MANMMQTKKQCFNNNPFKKERKFNWQQTSVHLHHSSLGQLVGRLFIHDISSGGILFGGHLVWWTFLSTDKSSSDASLGEQFTLPDFVQWIHCTLVISLTFIRLQKKIKRWDKLEKNHFMKPNLLAWLASYLLVT